MNDTHATNVWADGHPQGSDVHGRWCLMVPVLAAVLGLSAAPAVACDVPVFRYALEEFEADPYHFVIFHRGPLAAEAQRQVDSLKATANDKDTLVNITVKLVDLAVPDDKAKRPKWTPAADAPLPWLAVVPEGGEPVWEGPLAGQDVQSIVDSPARREVADRFFKGESAVFVLVESGRKADDEAAAKLLQDTLSAMEKSLSLPPKDDDSEELRSAVPLRIAFSTLRLRRDDPAEKYLVAILLTLAGETKKEQRPIVFPVFGAVAFSPCSPAPRSPPRPFRRRATFSAMAALATSRGNCPGPICSWPSIGKGGWKPPFRNPARRRMPAAPCASAAAQPQRFGFDIGGGGRRPGVETGVETRQDGRESPGRSNAAQRFLDRRCTRTTVVAPRNPGDVAGGRIADRAGEFLHVQPAREKAGVTCRFVRLILREILYRKTNFLLSTLAVLVAVGSVVAAISLLDRYAIRGEQRAAEQQVELKAKMAVLEDDYRKIALKLGFNVVILPKDQNLADFYADDFASKAHARERMPGGS